MANEWPLPPASACFQRGEGEALRRGSSFPGAAVNKLLAHLPPEVTGRLAPYLHPVHLERQEVLFRAQEPLEVVYFQTQLWCRSSLGWSPPRPLEVGLTGQDGVIGTALFPGIATMTCDGVVLIPGSAQRTAPPS